MKAGDSFTIAFTSGSTISGKPLAPLYNHGGRTPTAMCAPGPKITLEGIRPDRVAPIPIPPRVFEISMRLPARGRFVVEHAIHRRCQCRRQDEEPECGTTSPQEHQTPARRALRPGAALG